MSDTLKLCSEKYGNGNIVVFHKGSHYGNEPKYIISFEANNAYLPDTLLKRIIGGFEIHPYTTGDGQSSLELRFREERDFRTLVIELTGYRLIGEKSEDVYWDEFGEPCGFEAKLYFTLVW